MINSIELEDIQNFQLESGQLEQQLRLRAIIAERKVHELTLALEELKAQLEEAINGK